MFTENIYNDNFYKSTNNLKRNSNISESTVLESKNFLNYFQKSLEEISNIHHNRKNSIKKPKIDFSNISINNAMINLQKSSIAINLAIQIRNKLVSAYKEIMNQQV